MEEERTLTCGICHIVCTNKYNLHQHKVIHTNPSAFTCTMCDRHFSRKSCLRSHMRKVHNKILPHYSAKTAWTCEKCNKVFTQRQNLNRHQRTHDESRAYKCEACSKSYDRKSLLTEHKKSHRHRMVVIDEFAADEDAPAGDEDEPVGHDVTPIATPLRRSNRDITRAKHMLDHSDNIIIHGIHTADKLEEHPAHLKVGITWNIDWLCISAS